MLALGAAGLAATANRSSYTHYTWGVTAAIAVLLILVAASYRQTIFAYPSGGGSYLVSKDNLGVSVGLVAAAALLIDYVLTVGVSIAAGIQNLATIPLLTYFHIEKYLVFLCLFSVALLTLANLRGLRQAGALFAIPTYLFMLLAYLMISLGIAGPHIGWHLHTEAASQVLPPGYGVTRSVRAIGLLVMVANVHRGIIPALRYAYMISTEFKVLYVEIDPGRTQPLIDAWTKEFHDVPLEVLASPYRSLVRPVLDYIDSIERDPEQIVTIILPVTFTDRWWDILLHNSAGPMLKLQLLGRTDVVVASVRYHVGDAPL